MKFNVTTIAAFASFATIGFSACNGQPAAAGTNPTAAGNAQASPAAPSDAKANDSELTLALRYVSYVDGKGTPVVSKDQATAMAAAVSKLYSVCHMQVRIDDYVAANPADVKLAFSPSTMGELDTVRNAWKDDKYLLVVNTGTWDHSGGLGADGANAWTMMPGEGSSGAVLEAPVADNVNIVAHELGHYLNLDHVSDQSDLMNPVVYPDSTTITADQCQTMRASAQDARKDALRS